MVLRARLPSSANSGARKADEQATQTSARAISSTGEAIEPASSGIASSAIAATPVSRPSTCPQRATESAMRSLATPASKSDTMNTTWSSNSSHTTADFGKPACAASAGRKAAYTTQESAMQNCASAKTGTARGMRCYRRSG
ncbi:MAG: hypothetical protein IPL80_12485 [Sterolibacteriaceae bacterium]|nr:hypothetical protein [Sterolibacteriaceae bacterium]